MQAGYDFRDTGTEIPDSDILSIPDSPHIIAGNVGTKVTNTIYIDHLLGLLSPAQEASYGLVSNPLADALGRRASGVSYTAGITDPLHVTPPKPAAANPIIADASAGTSSNWLLFVAIIAVFLLLE